jgi:hypothetical protein
VKTTSPAFGSEFLDHKSNLAATLGFMRRARDDSLEAHFFSPPQNEPKVSAARSDPATFGLWKSVAKLRKC